MMHSPRFADAPWLRWLGLAAVLALPWTLGQKGARPAQAQPTTFPGTALVPLQGEADVVKARGVALTEALTRALEQAVTEVMPEARSRVYLVSGRARDFVTTYRVLQEGTVAGQFQLRLEAQIDLPRLQRELLGAASPAPAQRSVYLCSTQSTDLAKSVLEAARAQLQDTGSSVEILASAPCQETPDQSTLRGAAAIVSLSLSAEKAVPIRGTQPQQYGSRGHSEWRLFRVGQEPLQEATETTGFGPDPTASESEGARQAALSGLGALLSRSGPLFRGSPTVLVRVENLGSFRAYQQLALVLSSLPGVTRVEPRRFYIPARGEQSEDSVAQLVLQTSASVESLGATLGRTPIPGLRVQVVPVHAGELRVVCVASDAVPSAAQPSDPSDVSESEKLP